MPSVIDLVKCTIHGRFERSAKVAEKYRAPRLVYGSTFTQLMRCLNTRSASTVKRLVNEAIEAGLVKPVDVGVFGRRIVYKPTLRGVVYTAVQDVFLGCQKLAVSVVRKAVKANGGDNVLRLVDSVLNGGAEGLKEADNAIIEAIYNRLGKLRGAIIKRYVSLLVGS
jgi:hypothetical protein